MHKVLVSDPLSAEGVAKLKATPGIEVDVKTGLKPEELKSIIGEYSALAVRSETKVTADILAAANKLQIIGRAGVGVDNIDVEAATRKGVVVVNSPDGNTVAAAELTVGLLLSLARNIHHGDAALRAGRWDRKKLVGMEISGKTVGVIGLGKIGQAVANRLKAFGVELIAYNPIVPDEVTRAAGAEPVSLDALLERSDIITIHSPLNDATRGLIGADQIAKMKSTVLVINCARGGIVDEAAIAEAANAGKIGGYGFDVFSKEPAEPENPLLTATNCVVTPHLGASTAEAQIKVAVDVCEQIIDVLNGKPARTAVNLPALSAAEMSAVQPFQRLAEKIGSLHSQLALDAAPEGERPVHGVEILFNGDFSNLPTKPIIRSVLMGLMQPLTTETVNIVNAPHLADARGIRVIEQQRESAAEHTQLLTVRAHLPGGERTICGTIYGGEPHIVHIDGYHLDVVPEGIMLVTQHTDRPGVIGKVGTLFGDNSINIAGMVVGREASGGRAIMVLMLDSTIPQALLEQVRALPGMDSAQIVSL